MNVKKWLTEEERKDLAGSVGYASVHPAMDVSSVTKPYESLAACRALLDEAQEVLPPDCSYLHKAIATALKGVGGE